MLLENKNAIIYGAGGAVGGAVARVFAREGAKVFLTGHHLASVDAVAHDISTSGGVAESAQVDALDEKAVGKISARSKRKPGVSTFRLMLSGFPNRVFKASRSPICRSTASLFRSRPTQSPSS